MKLFVILVEIDHGLSKEEKNTIFLLLCFLFSNIPTSNVHICILGHQKLYFPLLWFYPVHHVIQLIMLSWTHMLLQTIWRLNFLMPQCYKGKRMSFSNLCCHQNMLRSFTILPLYTLNHLFLIVWWYKHKLYLSHRFFFSPSNGH